MLHSPTSAEHEPATPRTHAHDAGFTLTEIMTVIMILGILMSLATPTLLGARERAWDAAAESTLHAATEDAILSSDFRSDFTHASPATLATFEPAITFVDADKPSSGPNEVSVDASSEQRWVGTVLSKSGVCFAVVVGGGGQVFSEPDECRAAAVTEAAPAVSEGSGGTSSASTWTEPYVIENIAPKAKAYISSIKFGSVGNLVDGNTSGGFVVGEMLHSQESTNPHLLFVMPNAGFIESISIYNRTDCCSERASNVWIFVSESAGIPGTLAGAKASSASAFNIPGEVGRPTSVPINALGKYIRIFIEGRGPLHFAEVEMFGDLTP